jgi:hypothetical protein
VNLERDRTRTIEPAPPPLKRCPIQAECQFEFLLCTSCGNSVENQDRQIQIGGPQPPSHNSVDRGDKCTGSLNSGAYLKLGALVGANVWLDGPPLTLGGCPGKELLHFEAAILSGSTSSVYIPIINTIYEGSRNCNEIGVLAGAA